MVPILGIVLYLKDYGTGGAYLASQGNATRPRESRRGKDIREINEAASLEVADDRDVIKVLVE